MVTALRRMFWLAILGGVGYAAYTAWQRRHEPVPNGPAEWPPFDDAPGTGPTASGAPLPDVGAGTPTSAPLPDLGEPPVSGADASEAAAEATWAEPTNGICPVDFPIKGNANSGIYHVPGGRFYDRTVPERCYATEDAATADGYRRAKA